MRPCQQIAVWIDEGRSSSRPPVWRNHEGYAEDEFFLEINPNQRYRLCFHSKSEGRDDDQYDDYGIFVGFSVRVEPATRSLPEDESGPEAEKAMELLRVAQVTHELWHNLGDHFDFLRNREAVHHHLSNQIIDRLMGWTIIETIVVILMAVGQVWYWKTFFEQRRFL